MRKWNLVLCQQSWMGFACACICRMINDKTSFCMNYTCQTDSVCDQFSCQNLSAKNNWCRVPTMLLRNSSSCAGMRWSLFLCLVLEKNKNNTDWLQEIQRWIVLLYIHTYLQVTVKQPLTYSHLCQYMYIILSRYCWHLMCVYCVYFANMNV